MMLPPGPPRTCSLALTPVPVAVPLLLGAGRPGRHDLPDFPVQQALQALCV